jgi:hypothetical protein
MTQRARSDVRTLSSFDDIEFGRLSHTLPNGRIHVQTAIEQEVEKREEVGCDSDSTTNLRRDSTAYLFRDGRFEGA